MAHIMAHLEGSFGRSAHDPLRPTSAASHIAGLRPHAATRQPPSDGNKKVFLTVTGNRGRHEAAAARMNTPQNVRLMSQHAALDVDPSQTSDSHTDDAAHSAGLTLGSNAAPDRGRKLSPFERMQRPTLFSARLKGSKLSASVTIAEASCTNRIHEGGPIIQDFHVGGDVPPTLELRSTLI